MSSELDKIEMTIRFVDITE